MKLLALILSAAVSLGHPSVKTHLDALRERFHVVFVYDAALAPEKLPAPDRLSSGTLEACLDELFLGTDLIYTVQGRTVVLYRRPATDSLHRHDATLRAALIRAERMFRDTPGAVPVGPDPSVPMLLGEADPLKLSLLSPGVVPVTEGSASLVIRGGEPDGNLILMDGTPLYSATHLLGYLSVFDEDVLSRIRLYKGHFPTQYGGRASSVIDAEGRDGAADRIHGTVGAGILTDKLLLEGPVGGKTSVLVNGRVFGVGLLKSLFKVLERIGNYSFYDVYGRMTHNFSARDQLRVTVFRSGDAMEDSVFHGDWGTLLVSAAWHRQFSPSTEGTARLSWQRYTSGDNVFSSSIRDWQAAFDASRHAGGRHTLRWGGGYTFHDLTPTTIVRSRHTVHDVSAYAEEEWRRGRWTAVAGVHAHLFAVPGATYVSAQPRLFLQFAPSGWRFFSSVGRMVQPMHALTSSQSVTLPSDLWVCVSDRVAPMTSDQLSLGAEYRGPVSVTAEWWHRRMEGVLDYLDDRIGHIASGYWQDNVVAGHGEADGLEINLAGPSFWQVSYTLSRSRRRFADIDGGRWFPSAHDHRHSLTLSLRRDLTPHIQVNSLWTYLSGGYMTVPERYAFEMTPEGRFEQKPVYEGRNNFHLPASNRWDLGILFHWEGRRREHRLTVGVYNAYASRNPSFAVMGYGHSAEYGSRAPIEVHIYSLFRALPSFSYSFRF